MEIVEPFIASTSSRGKVSRSEGVWITRALGFAWEGIRERAGRRGSRPW